MNRCIRVKARHRVIEIGRGARKEAVAPRAQTVVALCRNPVRAVFAPDMNEQIGLDGSGVVAAGTRVRCSRSIRCRMDLAHMLCKSTFLDKGLFTSRLSTHILLFACVGLHMIEHCVLAVLGNAALRAHIFALLVLCVGGGCNCL